MPKLLMRIERTKYSAILLLFLLSCLTFFLNLNGWDLWNPDEPRYAQVAREMLDTGEWILPHLNGDIYPDKPPFFFWLIAIFSFLTGGVTEVSARIPSSLSAVGCVLLTYFMGKRLFNDRVGILAGLILLTSTEFFWLGRRANIDMTLTLFITLALTFFYLGLEKKEGRPWFCLASYVFMALGVLTKGPIGFLLPFLIIVSYLTATKKLNYLKKLEITWGLIIFAGIVLAWLIPACVQGGENYTWELLFKQSIDRFLNAWNHEKPFYYYIYTFPEGFFPWILFLPIAIWWGLKGNNRENRAGFYFPFCWFVIIFIFFSASTCKRNLYLLPLYPAASILTGSFLNQFIFQHDRKDIFFKILIVSFYFLGGIFIKAGLVFGILPFVETSIPEIWRFVPYIMPLAIIFIAAGGYLIFMVRQKKMLSGFIAVILTLFLFILVSIEVILPKVNTFKSAKYFSQSINHHLKNEKEIVAYGIKTAPFNFYTGLNKIRTIPTIEKLVKHLDSPAIGLILLREKVFNRLREESLMPLDIHIVDKAKIGHRTFLLLAKRDSRLTNDTN